MTRCLTLKYWITEVGVYGRVLERDVCLEAATLEELEALAKGTGGAPANLTLIPGEDVPEEAFW